MTLKIKITINKKPPSLNHVNKYRAQGRRVVSYKSQEAKEFNLFFNKAISDHDLSTFQLYSKTLDRPCLVASYIVQIPNCFTKKGDINKRAGDWTNLIKYAEDCFFKHVEMDDAQIMLACVEKRQGEIKLTMEYELLELSEYLNKAGT